MSTAASVAEGLVVARQVFQTSEALLGILGRQVEQLPEYRAARDAARAEGRDLTAEEFARGIVGNDARVDEAADRIAEAAARMRAKAGEDPQ